MNYVGFGSADFVMLAVSLELFFNFDNFFRAFFVSFFKDFSFFFNFLILSFESEAVSSSLIYTRDYSVNLFLIKFKFVDIP